MSRQVGWVSLIGQKTKMCTVSWWKTKGLEGVSETHPPDGPLTCPGSWKDFIGEKFGCRSGYVLSPTVGTFWAL